jgi:hypothetical protein
MDLAATVQIPEVRPLVAAAKKYVAGDADYFELYREDLRRWLASQLE